MVRSHARRGAVLILVAGIGALLAALSIAFLARTREQTADGERILGEAQARIMLAAACGYVLEAGRLGYDAQPPSAGPHREAFGWLDVRDGRTGPRDASGADLFSATPVERSHASGPVDRPAWPAIGGVARCPMQVRARPPFATRLDAAPNAIAVSGPDAGLPYLRHPDPMPVVANGWPGTIDASAFLDYARGDARPRPESVGLAWFRVRRESDARFVVTCGAGGTLGWRDWDEVPAAERGTFADDPAVFAQLLGNEVRTWYRIEWCAAVGPSDSHSIENEATRSVPDPTVLHPMNATQMSHARSLRSQARCPNCLGTIRWIERLAAPPAAW